MKDILSDIRIAIDSFEMERARELLRDALKEPTPETYYLASLASLTKKQRVDFLNRAIELDPFYEEATEALATLNENELTTEKTTPNQVESLTKSPPSKIDNKNNPAVVTGKISGETKAPLYQIPTISGTIRTQMPISSEVTILTRDKHLNWFNIVFTSSTGQQLLGWVETKLIDEVNFLGNSIELLDLPITQFEWNTRDDIDGLIKAKRKSFPGFRRGILLLVAGLFACPITILLSQLYMAGFREGIVLFIGSLVGLGFVVYAIIVIYRRFDSRRSSADALEIKQLKKIKQGKKPDGQKLLEKQMIMAAMQTAMNVGTTIVTKMVPEKKDITIRNK
jgi:hypothetical protein